MNNRPNLYKPVHKGIRSMLLDLTLKSGRVDWNDRAAVSAFGASARAVFEILESHAAVENAFIAPLLERFAPRVAAIIGSGHDEQEQILPALLAEIESFDSNAADAIGAGHAIVVRLSRFAGESLAHMADEEELAMTAMQSALDDEALFDLDRRIAASIPPEKLQQFGPVMMAALNHADRLQMLNNLQDAGAQKFAFGMLLAAQVLSPEDYAALERGLASNRAA
ncbi:MAG TPA: hemerythrin domain-containing protein [Thermoanaerobaculia bacterium]|nr:hemerythrin domain-containing protein [Thermoanaerobaculia bacterium]